MILSDPEHTFQGHGVSTDALDVLCAQLMRDLFALTKFLVSSSWSRAYTVLVLTYNCVEWDVKPYYTILYHTVLVLCLEIKTVSSTDVRNTFLKIYVRLWFGFWKKNADSARNERRSVRISQLFTTYVIVE